MDRPEPRDWKASARAALLHGSGAAFVAMFTFVTARRVSFLREAYWAPIAAIVVLYPDLRATEKAGVERFLGTAIGSLVGWGAAVWWNGNILVYGLAVLVSVGACYLSRIDNASRLCAVAVTVITLVPRHDAAHNVALHRFIEVSYGVACALAYVFIVDWVARKWPRIRGEGVASVKPRE